MNEQESQLVTATIIPSIEDGFSEKVIVTVEGNDFIKDLSDYGLSFESNDRDVIDALAPVIREEFGVDISDYYKVRKAVNNRNVYIIPSSVAG